MKKLIRQAIFCGISGKMGCDSKYHFTVDFEKNDPENDAIQFIKPYFRQSQLNGVNICWFGYQFNGKLDRVYRDACISYLKNVQPVPTITEDNMYDDHIISTDGISEADLYTMIERSFRGLGLHNLSVDAVVYPISSSNMLVKYIAKSVRRYLNECSRLSFHEIVKADPKNITIDVVGCMADINDGLLDDCDGLITKSYLMDLQDTVRSKSEFSLKQDISPMSIRPYVSNFLALKDANQALNSAEKVLIVDDFNTTGTTLSELVRIVRQYNNTCQIYVFTLLGNSRKALQ